MDFSALAFDPGGTTGICYAIKKGPVLRLLPTQIRLSCREMYNYIAENHEHFPLSAIIYESFEFRKGARAGLDLTPVELIGVIKLFDHIPTYKQTAFQGKGYYSDNVLKALGIYKANLRHGMDATRHLMQWYTFGAGYKYNSKDVEVRLG